PLNMKPHWFGGHVAYSIAQYGMSMGTLRMAEELKGQVAVSSLWPRTAIATAAIANILGGEEGMKQTRRPEIMADAAHAILTKDFRTHTGHFLIDDDVLRAEGVKDFSKYNAVPGVDPLPDFF